MITFDDGRRLEIGLLSTDSVEKLLAPIRALFALDDVRVDLSLP